MLGRCDHPGSPGREQFSGCGVVGDGRSWVDAAPAVSAPAAVYHHESGACPSLRREHVPGDALPGGYSAENLQHHRQQLGAGRESALQRDLQGRRESGPGYRPGTGQSGGGAVVQGHGRRKKRNSPGFCGSWRCGNQGHRRGSTAAGFGSAGTADFGAACGKNRTAALPAGAELEHHGADEYPAGGYSHQ